MPVGESLDSSIGNCPTVVQGMLKKKAMAGRVKSTDKNMISVAGNRRPRFADITRKRGPKPKIRGILGVPRGGPQVRITR